MSDSPTDTRPRCATCGHDFDRHVIIADGATPECQDCPDSPWAVSSEWHEPTATFGADFTIPLQPLDLPGDSDARPRCAVCGRPDDGDESLFHDPRAVRNAGKRDYIHPFSPAPAPYIEDAARPTSFIPWRDLLSAIRAGGSARISAAEQSIEDAIISTVSERTSTASRARPTVEGARPYHTRNVSKTVANAYLDDIRALKVALQEARDEAALAWEGYHANRTRADAAESTIAGLREQVSAMDREMAALSSDKQTLMIAVTHWREQVEGMRAALVSIQGHWPPFKSASDELLAVYFLARNALAPAATPVNSTHCGEADWVPGSCPGCTKCDPEHYPAPGDGALPPDARTNEEK